MTEPADILMRVEGHMGNRPARRSRVRRSTVVAVAAGVLLAAVAIAVVLVALPGPFWVVQDSGPHLVPYTTGAGEVQKVRVADLVTVYVDREKPRAPDTATGSILLGGGAALLLSALLARRRGRSEQLVWCFALGGAGLAFLGADELGSLHETVGHNLRFLVDLPTVEHPDNVLLSLYALPALAYLHRYRRVIGGRPLAAAILGMGVIAYVVIRVADHENLVFEERAEVVAALLVAAGFLVLAWQELRERGTARPLDPRTR